MPLLTIDNLHPDVEPPSFDDALVVSYYRSRHGDQWVYAIRDGREELWGGDIDWQPADVGNLVLDMDEAAWLKACRGSREPRS